MSGPWHPTGRGQVNARNPVALAVCDRCGFTYNRPALAYQFQWAGLVLNNLNLLVCDRCMDVPQPQLKTIILPPDPLPINDPRAERYAAMVPSYASTETGDHMVTLDGDNITQEIRVTPTPAPPPYYTFEE